MIGKLRALQAKQHDSTIMLINNIHFHTFNISLYTCTCVNTTLTEINMNQA